jgi:hypothetical protein
MAPCIRLEAFVLEVHGVLHSVLDSHSLAHSVQDSFTTLEELLTKLPDSISFNIEISMFPVSECFVLEVHGVLHSVLDSHSLALFALC